MTKRWSLALFAVLLVLGISSVATAHPFHTGAGFVGGATHPWTGIDHLLAMVAVGLWAAQLGGSAVWKVPAAFVALMLVGGALGMAGVPLPYVESGIFVSVLVLGLLIATAARLPVGVSMLVVGLFALFHGHAHGTEMAAGASAFSYAAGFALTTAFLHAMGIGLGFALRATRSPLTLRFAGGAIACASLLLLV